MLLDLILTPYKYDKNKQLIDYTKKMEIIIEEMKLVLEKNKKYIKFNNFKNLDMDDIYMCLGLEENSCNANNNCSFSEENDGMCVILLPKKNILNDVNENYLVLLAIISNTFFL